MRALDAAKACGVAYSSISNWRRSEGRVAETKTPKRPRSDSERKKLIAKFERLASEGLSGAEAARVCNVAITTITYWLKDAGKPTSVEAYRRKWKKAVIAKFEKLVAGGMAETAAAKECGVHRVTIRKWLGAAGRSRSKRTGKKQSH
ncbi:MAG: hypothetical protein ABIP48_33790 [Planctomycetota bacterium]